MEPLIYVLIEFPRKRTSNTGVDSGIKSPHVLPPATPVTSDDSHNPPFCPIPSTSRMDPFPKPPSWPLTPYQQFINNRDKTKNNEPKYSRPRPDRLDSQSVPRTNTRQG